MPLMTPEYRDRLKHWQRVLSQDFYHPLGDIAFEGFTTMEHLTPEQALQGDFKPVPVGLEWGHTWEYMWVRSTVTLPEAAEGQPIAMSLDMGGEASVWQRRALGTAGGVGVRPHHYISDNVLTSRARPGKPSTCSLRFTRGITSPTWAAAHRAVLPAPMGSQGGGPPHPVGRSTFGVWNEPAYQLGWTCPPCHADGRAARGLPCGPARLRRPGGITRIVDSSSPWRSASPAMTGTGGSASADGGPQRPTPRCWLPWATRTWIWPGCGPAGDPTARPPHLAASWPAGALSEYKYIQSSPPPIDVPDHYPPCTRRSVRREGGPLDREGAMYVEPDTTASGEALIASLVYRQAVLQGEAGVDSRMLWLPDTFATRRTAPAAAQLRRGLLVTQKFSGVQRRRPFPYHYFTWKGMDGSSVTSSCPPATLPHRPPGAVKIWRGRVQKLTWTPFMIPFGTATRRRPCRDYVNTPCASATWRGGAWPRWR